MHPRWNSASARIVTYDLHIPLRPESHRPLGAPRRRTGDYKSVVCECSHLSDFTHGLDSPISITPLAVPIVKASRAIYYPLLVRPHAHREPSSTLYLTNTSETPGGRCVSRLVLLAPADALCSVCLPYLSSSASPLPTSSSH